jgi:hypothetical protein
MLGIDECTDAAAALRLCDHVVDERRLSGGLRPEDLDDAAAREPAEPVDTAPIETCAWSFIFMTAPLPN